MDSNKKLGAGASALATLVTLSAGCTDHKLPPNPVPAPEVRRATPGWFDANLRWDPNKGDTRIFIEGKIVFQVDPAVTRPESEQVLQQLLKFLQERPDITRVRIEGHTDSTASNDYNQELSARRALAVADWLVDRGIDHLRLVAAGYGEEKPLAPNELREGRAENRRTEFHVMEVNGRPFGPSNALDGGMVLTVLSAEERALLRNPPKVEMAKSTFSPEGNIIKPAKEQPKKTGDDVQSARPQTDKPASAAPLEPVEEKKD